MTDPIITKPGIYGDLDIEKYHSQCCPGPSFSSSNLRAIELTSPAHCFAHWTGNPDRVSKSTKALAFGSAAHALILGDEAFDTRHVIQPFANYNKIETIGDVLWKTKVPEKISDKDAEKVKYGQMRFKSVWKQEMLDAGKVIVTEDDLVHIKNMAEVLNASPTLEGVFSGDVEQSAFWKDEQTGLWLKSRLDVRPLGDTFMDLKTTVNAAPHACASDITKRAYDMQFALGTEGLWLAGGQKIHAHLIVFIEKEPPYAMTPVEIGAQAIWDSARRNRRSMDHIKMCMDRDEWPGYAMPDPYNHPHWLQLQLDADDEAGLLPPAPAWLEELKIDINHAETAPDQEVELS